MARPIRTFLDSGVLIAAYKGSPSIEVPANNILDDPNRVFLSSLALVVAALVMGAALPYQHLIASVDEAPDAGREMVLDE
jgi:hypothetical protein